MIKTRFRQELDGDLGEFWKKHAEKELDEVRKDIADGKIVIDSEGIAYNCIGRVVMSDMLEKIALVSDEVDVEATKAAYEVEATKSINEYKEKMKNHVYSEEEINEMRAAFGTGTTIVDIFTGKRIAL